jgi:hypothetical protein
MIEIVLKRKNGELVKVRWTHVDDKGVNRKVEILKEYDNGTSLVRSLTWPYSVWEVKPGYYKKPRDIGYLTREAIVSDKELWFVTEDGRLPEEGDQLITLNETTPADTEVESNLVAL